MIIQSMTELAEHPPIIEQQQPRAPMLDMKHYSRRFLTYAKELYAKMVTEKKQGGKIKMLLQRKMHPPGKSTESI